MTNTSTDRPTLTRIARILSEGANADLAWDATSDALIYSDGSRLTAQAIHDQWDTIRPNDNDGRIDDPAMAVVFGAIMSGDLWAEAE